MPEMWKSLLQAGGAAKYTVLRPGAICNLQNLRAQAGSRKALEKERLDHEQTKTPR